MDSFAPAAQAHPIAGTSNNANTISAGLRVLSTSSDPAEEHRTTLATLTARAGRLGSDNVDHRAVCSGRGLYEVSRRAVQETRQLAAGQGVGVGGVNDVGSGGGDEAAPGGGMYAPISQASAELFMAKHLGFDVQVQRRMLQQLHNSQRQMAAAIANTERANNVHNSNSNAVGLGGGMATVGPDGSIIPTGGATFSGGVDALVARLKSGIIAQAQNEVHLRERELLQRHEYTVFKAAWSPFYVGVADDLEMLAMRQGDDPSRVDLRNSNAALATLRGGGGIGNTAASSSSSAMPGASGLIRLLHSGSPVADEINRKIAAFAPIVARYPPAQWMAHFCAHVRDRAGRSGDELAVLWVTAERILSVMGAHGASSSSSLAYVAASRQVMEEKALGRLLTATMRIDPSRVEEVAGMPSGRVMDLIARGAGGGGGTTNPWAHLFEAMRVGRYDVAAECAKRSGSSALEAALQRWAAAASPRERAGLPPALELRELYAEVRRGGGGGGGAGINNNASNASNTPSHDYDAHKHAVLFLLLAGSTGESTEVNKRVLLDLCSRVGSSIEDALWMRLCCIRSADETTNSNNGGGGAGPVQSLAYMQAIILDDLQDLVTMAHKNAQRIASFLMHALLPTSGLRLLLESDVTCVDGLHLALCFNHANALQTSCSQSSLETPIDTARHIARYCSVVLLDADRRSLDGLAAGAATFDYFHKMGFDEAFSEFCLKDAVAARLFGQRGTLATPPPPPPNNNHSYHHQQQQQQLDGLLLTGGGPLSVDLMAAMGATAELAAGRNNTPLALHLLLALARACLRSSSSSPRGGNGRSIGGGGNNINAGQPTTDAKAVATAVAALQRAVRIACPALAQAFYLNPHTNHAGALLNTCAQLREAVRETGVETLTTGGGGVVATRPSPTTAAAASMALSPSVSLMNSTMQHSGINGSGAVAVADLGTAAANAPPPLSRADVAAFESLCAMADVFMGAHAGHTEQALGSFFSLPFIPSIYHSNSSDASSPSSSSSRGVEACAAAFTSGGGGGGGSSSSTAAVVAAAGAIVPLALRLAASALQYYDNQQQQQQQQRQLHGSAQAEAAGQSAIALRRGMQLVCAWLRQCGALSTGGSGGGGVGSGSSGASLYEACAGSIAEFEQRYLR